MDYQDITLSYPSLEFLQSLTFHLKHEIFEERTPIIQGYFGFGKNIQNLKPFLDDWFHPRDYWYAHDCIHALEQLINAKVFVNRKLSETDEGLLFLGSEKLHKKEKKMEKEILLLLSKKSSNSFLS